MEYILELACQHILLIPIIIVGLLFLSGLFLPVSEELVLIFSGSLVSLCNGNYIILWLSCYLGSWTAGWMTYWIGRTLGPKIEEMTWFRHYFKHSLILKFRDYFDRYGILTFIFGRFTPGGVRNVMIATSGIIKMPFKRYLIYDGIACFISSNVFFYIGYLLGYNLPHLKKFIGDYEHFSLILTVIILVAAIFLIVYYFSHRFRAHNDK